MSKAAGVASRRRNPRQYTGFSSYRGPADLKQQIEAVRTSIYAMRDATFNEKACEAPLCRGCEGLFAIPNPAWLDPGLTVPIYEVMLALARVYEGRFANLSQSTLRPGLFVSDARAVSFPALVQSQGNHPILIIQGQLGIYKDRIDHLLPSESLATAYVGLSMLLTNPNRLAKPTDPWLEMPGSFQPEAEMSDSGPTIPFLRRTRSGIEFCNGYATVRPDLRPVTVWV